MNRPTKNRLRQLRERGLVLSQSQVATLLGIEPSTVSRHEAGKRKLSDEDVQKYAALFGVPEHQVYFTPEQAKFEESRLLPEDGA